MNQEELQAKYKNLHIVKGSLKRGRGTSKMQVTVQLPCHTIKRFTSDLWHLRNCPVCGEPIQAKRGRKASK
jgi:hypothetical protein